MAKIAQDSTLKEILEELRDVNHVIKEGTTNVPLLGSKTWIGDWYDISGHNSLVVACLTDRSGILYVDFSIDKTNVDSSLPFTVTASLNEVHRVTVTRQYVRIRFANTSVDDQTYLRIQTLAGSHSPLNSSLNSQIQSDQDTIVVRPLDFNLMIAEGLYQNRTNTIKDGINFDIDAASTPEDITNEGGTYAGFVSATAAAEVVVAGADTGTVYYSYMATDTDTDYTIGSVSVTGIGTYALGHNIWRCNFAYFVNTGTPANLNAGDITVRHTATPTNVFCVIPTGYSQSFCAAYTVPYGSSVYVDRFSGNMRGSSTGSLDGVFYYKPYGESPRYRFPFELQYGTLYFDDVDYLIRIPERVDFIPRILVSSANNLAVKFSYRLLKVKS